MAGRRNRNRSPSDRGFWTRLRLSARALSEFQRLPPFRLFVFALTAGLWLALIVVRLWDLQIRQAPRLTEKAQQQQEDVIEIAARRGRIYDRNGVELARSTPVDSIGVFPTKVGDPELAATLLAEVLRENPNSLRKKLKKKRFQWVRRLAEPAEAERIRELPLAGLHFEKESKRYYPKGTVAAHILGAVGVDHMGLAGLEQTFEAKLRGVSGQRSVQVDALQHRYASQVIQEPVPGYDLVLTIDQRIQVTAEKELGRAIEETQAEAGTIVVMDPVNGDILGMANWPTFDPNDREPSKTDLEHRKNYALSHMIEPGSTFKVVTVAAGLEEKVTTPEEMIDCERGGIYLLSRWIRDHKPFALLSVADVLARSSNVGTIKLGLRLSPERLHRYARAFGFGQPTGLPLPGETAGLLRPWERWHPAAIGSVAIGQEVGVTALQMARGVSVMANGGSLVTPRIIESILSPQGEPTKPDVRESSRVLNPDTAAIMRALMERVVREGTGRRARTPGYRVAGKTGTAQKVDPETGRYSTKDYVASFVGFAPVNAPSIVVVIVLDSPVGMYYGGQVAAPVFPRVATEVLRFRDVPPELPLEQEPVRPIPEEWWADFAIEEPARDWPGSTQVEFPVISSDEDAVVVTVASLTDSASPRLGDVPLVSNLTMGGPNAASPPEPQAVVEGTIEEAEPADMKPARLTVVEALLPDFRGETVDSVISRTSSLGLAVHLRGSGRAWRQWPPAGTPIQFGGTVTVDFRVGAKQ